MLGMRVIDSQRGSVNRERALQESLGLVILTQTGEVVERDGDPRVLGTEGLNAYGDGSLVESLGLVVLAMSLQQNSEVEEN